MSAAEKLKALGQPWWSDYDTDRIVAALPQIVAVVEAAERAAVVASEERQDHIAIPLHIALSDLNETLS